QSMRATDWMTTQEPARENEKRKDRDPDIDILTSAKRIRIKLGVQQVVQNSQRHRIPEVALGDLAKSVRIFCGDSRENRNIQDNDAHELDDDKDYNDTAAREPEIKIILYGKGGRFDKKVKTVSIFDCITQTDKEVELCG